MRIETLQEFVVLANMLNFSKAAKTLHLAQPTLSSHISSLENELGFSLFTRTNPLQISEPGLVFLNAVKKSLQTLSEGIEIARLMSPKKKRVRVACSRNFNVIYHAFETAEDNPFEMVEVDLQKTFFGMIETPAHPFL